MLDQQAERQRHARVRMAARAGFQQQHLVGRITLGREVKP
jgi:hypothetical protein